MNLVAIMASYRKGRTIDTLIDRAIAGVQAANPATAVEKIVLVDRHIEYCRNCMVCKQDDPAKPYARCVIPDDMTAIYPLLANADAFLFGTPINMGRETAILKTFMERCCWVLAKPGHVPIEGCPAPRCPRTRKAAAILSTGTVPPWLRLFCDDATVLIKDFCKCMLNARLTGSLYAGAVEKRSPDHYADAAFRLGRKLAAG